MIFTLYDYSCYYLYSLLLLFLVILNKTLAACIFYFILFYFFNLFPDFPRIPWNLLIPFVSPICMLCKSFIKKKSKRANQIQRSTTQQGLACKLIIERTLSAQKRVHTPAATLHEQSF